MLTVQWLSPSSTKTEERLSVGVDSLLSVVREGVAGHWEAAGMAIDMPCASYLALYVVSMHILSTNSRTSTHHWKLNVAEDKVQAAPLASPDEAGEHLLDGIPVDPMLSILTNKVTLNGEWKLDGEATCHEDCARRKPAETNGSGNSSNGWVSGCDFTRLDSSLTTVDCLTSIGIPIIKMRRSWDRLIFIVEIPTLARPDNTATSQTLYWISPQERS